MIDDVELSVAQDDAPIGVDDDMAADGQEPMIRIIDAHEADRAILTALLETIGLASVGYGSAKDFLARDDINVPGCLVLETRIPDRNGLSLQADLVAQGVRLPIIFVTGFGDIRMTVQAMRAGAIDFLTKPIRDHDVLDAIERALDQDRSNRTPTLDHQRMRDQLAQLTPRELQVLQLVSGGLKNKDVADRLGLSVITVKIHRSTALRKLGSPSILKISPWLELLPASA